MLELTTLGGSLLSLQFRLVVKLQLMVDGLKDLVWIYLM